MNSTKARADINKIDLVPFLIKLNGLMIPLVTCDRPSNQDCGANAGGE